MKGIINAGIQDYVIARHGDEFWWRVKEDAGIREFQFDPSHDYPDEWTERFLDILSKGTGESIGELLREIGRFLVTNTLKEVYPSYLTVAGEDAFTVLERVGEIHQRAVLNVPNAKPPVIDVVERGEDRIVIRYQSERRLFTLMQGLMEGLGDLFKRPVEVRRMPGGGGNGESECLFEVRFP